MPSFRRQYPAGGYLLDVYAERERIAFELDGHSFHASPVQRERDLRRDAALAALGIQVVRFTYARLISEPDAVRREVLAILAAAARPRRGVIVAPLTARIWLKVAARGAMILDRVGDGPTDALIALINRKIAVSC